MESRNVEEKTGGREKGEALFVLGRESSVWMTEHAIVDERSGRNEVNESSCGPVQGV